MPQSSDNNEIQEEIRQIGNLLSEAMKIASQPGTGETLKLLNALTQAAGALHRVEASYSQKVEAKASQFEALARVGSEINSSLELPRVLSDVMDNLVTLMGAQRGFLMLKDSDENLIVQVARGIDQIDLDQDEFAISKTVVNKVVETGRLILTRNAQDDPRFESRESVSGFRLLSILCVPLKIKDHLIGVIYLDNRSLTGAFNDKHLDLIAALSDQAAIALQNARLFDELQAGKDELEIAYHATLEGWVRALDLRDKETEGHTQRVTSLTIQLARKMGFIDDDIVHIRRGSLLHDIGKMAIPDGILLKPGRLTDDERAIVEQHPQFACDVLYPIKFLQPVLDIPYCHHEKWDGSGYPRGLKGDNIPKAARLFAVVDVWDALVSDRPYRAKMSPAEAEKIIRELSGSHFEPSIVDAFFALEEVKEFSTNN